MPDDVTELHGDEGGRWEVKTQGSVHIFDLDVPNVTRHPGVGAQPSVNDVTRPLRNIEACAVGKRGYWTMEPDHYLLDHYWQITSSIVRITRCPDETASDDE
jgi:hypothetical protein